MQARSDGRVGPATGRIGLAVAARVLRNDYRYPGVGFDNDEGLKRHQTPLFKWTPKY